MQIKPIFRNLKIRNKIFAVSLLLLMIFGILGIISYQFFTSMYEDRISEESAAMLQLSSTVLDEELAGIEDLSFKAITDDQVQKDLRTIQQSNVNFEIYQAKVRLQERLLYFATSEPYIAAIQVIDSSGLKYTYGFNTKVELDKKEILPLVAASKGSNVWSKNGEEENIISSARLIRSKENLDLREMGYLIISVDMNALIEETLNFSPNKNFIITNGQEIFYQNPDSEIGAINTPEKERGEGYQNERINGKDYMSTYVHSRFSDLTYYHFLPFSDITQQNAVVKSIMVLTFLSMFILSIIVSRKAAEFISKPLEDLSRNMKEVQSGDFEHTLERLDSDNEDEIGLLHSNFRIMIDKINDLIKENYKKQLMIKETEYKALQAQINPHFLYNTLDSINWMARINQQKKISVMVEALGNMMRNIISKKEALVTLKDEMEIVKHYITIQEYRFENRLNFAFHSLLDLESHSIPKLSIQPIVENAIAHGLEEMTSQCDITIYMFPKAKDIEIVIEDNGPGMTEERIDAIYRGEIHSKSSGIGLKNIIERIKLMFGEEYGVRIESTPGVGTKVKIIIPYSGGEGHV
ncbi:sensor histidine kinase YesM [Rossellomorea marisflavi]|uniref:sensor histidine kinase n=2 Tax=Rossellomorea marisflavi TaxID=189381 RepID=UPI0025C8B2A5|nr:sensor histidine kinase [Rossellomorea marisflavi]UTE73269.1 sensor histidine kinase [Rossellomorea marisflavi]GLI86289.1 sensor histidine kinase YesM [Rossellomorea marisflavi]